MVFETVLCLILKLFGKDMPPNVSKASEPEKLPPGYYTGKLANEIGTDPNYKPRVYRPAVAMMSGIHVGALIGLYCIFFEAKWSTILWMLLVGEISGEAITLGTHRYYSHRSFKASFGLRLLIVICNLLSGQNSIYTWVKDHRLHHKFSDTDADPHNANRGFFFSHMGWLLYRKHPAVKEKYKTLDLSDLHADKLVMFQYKHFLPLYFLVSVVIPVVIPIYFFGESFIVSLTVCYFFRYCLTLHSTWCVNSVAHMWGYKPYDKNILPTETWFVSFITNGEGWHNYHHAFPWDYKAAEYGMSLNFTASLIEFFNYFGFAYDLRTASEGLVNKRIERTGDGSHTNSPLTPEESGQ